MSINTEMTALADAIRDKSGVTGKLSISGMTTAVSNISVGGGESGDIDLSGVTVTADKMLSGIVAVGADGNKVTGNIQTVTPSVNKNTFTVGKGYVAEAFSQTIAEATVTETDSSVTITPGYVAEELNYELGGSGGSVDLSFVTAGAKQILAGYVGADAQGNPINGEMPDEWYDIVIVKSWHPEYPACTGLSQIVVSGMTDIGSEEDGDFTAYSEANGTYLVTPETERIEKPFGRIYKHESKEWYIWGNYDSEYEEGYWHISQSTDSSGLTYMTGNEQLASGTFTFEDFDWGASFDVTLDVTETVYEEQPAEAVVIPLITTSEDPEFIVYQWDVIPQVGRTYDCGIRNTPCPYLFGRAKDIGNGIDGEGLTLLTRWGLPGGSGDTEGRVILDETGMCEIRRLDNTDLISTTSYTKSLFGNRLIDFKYFDSNEGAVLIKKLPLLDAFTVEFWAFMKDQRPDLWGGCVMVNRTKWDETGELDDSTVVKASTDTSHAIYKQWYHHAFTHGAGSSLIKEWVNGVIVAEHDFSIPLGGDDEFLFAPASRGANTSAKYVAQLAIWDRVLSDTDGTDVLRFWEIENIARYKQPYSL